MQSPVRPVPEMPRHDADNDVLSAVLAEYSLTLEDLARATGISSSFLSRVFAGQYAAPPALIRAMWRATRDHRVLRVALGDQAIDQVAESLAIADPARDQRLALALQAVELLSRVTDGLVDLPNGKSDPRTLTRDIDAAGRALLAVRSHLQTATRRPVDCRA